MARTVSDFVADALVSAGVTHVFGGHGGAVVPLIEAIEAHPKLTWVYMRNEANASLAAHAAAKLNPGVVGCCLATSGPGATNLTTGLVCGKMDAVPMIAITGLKPSYKAGLVDFQDIENDRLFAGILDYSKRVVHPFQAPLLMRDALGFAVSRRTCVHLAFPEDIQEHELDENHEVLLESAIHPLLSSPPSTNSVQKTADFMQAQAAAKSRVLIAVGHLGVGAGPEITALAEMMNAPIVTRLDAKGVIDESHPLCIGVAGVHGSPGVAATRDMIESADCIFSVGVEDQMLGQFLITGGVQNRDLVYVMPDTSTVTGQFNSSAVLIGTVVDSIRLLTEELASRGAAKAFEQPKQDGVETDNGALDKMIDSTGHNFPVTLAWSRLQSGAWRTADSPSAERIESLEAFRAELAPEPAGCCHPAEIYAAINKRLGPDDTLSVDTGDQTIWAAALGRLTRGTRTISDEFMGTMGYALPSAVAASCHQPNATHVAVVGDGAAQMTINELATAKQMNARVVMVVFINNVLGRVRYGFGPSEVPGTEIDTPDFVALAKAYGHNGAYVTNAEEADAAIEAAWGAKGVFLVQVHLDRHLSAHMEKLTSDDHQLMHLTLELKGELPKPMQMLRRPVAMRALLDSVNNDLDKAREHLAYWRQEFTDENAYYSNPKAKSLDEYLLFRVWQTRVQDQVGSVAADTIVTIPGPRVKNQPVSAGFPGNVPAHLLRQTFGIELATDWESSWQTKASALFAAKAGNGPQDYAQFLQSGQSNEREMSWTVISIPPNRSFPLHAHPSIEVIYVAKGTMHEMRLIGQAPTRDFGVQLEGPDLSGRTKDAFTHHAISQGEMLVNEVGSIHQSYTKEEGCVLLCLWSSAHADIPCCHMPKSSLLEDDVAETATVIHGGGRPPVAGQDVKYTCT